MSKVFNQQLLVGFTRNDQKQLEANIKLLEQHAPYRASHLGVPVIMGKPRQNTKDVQMGKQDRYNPYNRGIPLDHIDDSVDPTLKEKIRNSNIRFNNFNLDIDKSYPNPNKYLRLNKDYNTLDYSDVTYGNVDNKFSDNHAMGVYKSGVGKSNLIIGRGL